MQYFFPDKQEEVIGNYCHYDVGNAISKEKEHKIFWNFPILQYFIQYEKRCEGFGVQLKEPGAEFKKKENQKKIQKIST